MMNRIQSIRGHVVCLSQHRSLSSLTMTAPFSFPSSLNTSYGGRRQEDLLCSQARSRFETIPTRHCCSHFSKQNIHSFSSKSNNDDEVMVSIEEAKTTTTKALQKIGWDEHDATLQAEIMTAAELCGNNQGLVKMYQPSLMAPSSSDGMKPTLEKETKNSAVYNGNQAPGMLAALMAADKAIDLLERNEENSISISTSYNTSTSSGQLGFYVERMAERGFVGIAFANSPEFVAAAPGGKGVFGTNPMAVGIPQAGSPPFTVSF